MKPGHDTIIDDVPTLLLPVETVSRELDSKIVMAAAVAARGCRAIVGHKEEISVIGAQSGPLVWQGKNLFSDEGDDHMADRLLKNGSAIMYMQDEGGMFQVSSWKENVIQKHHLDHVRTRPIHRMCAWGRKQREVMSAHAPEISDRIRVTGTPRFDLCTPTFEWMTRSKVDEIRGRCGRYILACTRFGSIAHADGIHDAFRRKLNPRIWPKSIDMDKVTDIWFEKWHQDTLDFAEFVVLIKELARAHPDVQIILRPHPSEGLLFYQHAFSRFENVEIVREGNVINWIRAAVLVLHCNCTTGIEAVLAGRPVMNFLPGSGDREPLDVEVAREAGMTARSVPEALDTAGDLLAGRVSPPGWSERALSILNNLEADAVPLLADETIAVLEERGLDGSSLVMPSKQRVRRAVRRLLGKSEFERTPYITAKRGPLDRQHVEMMLEGCRSHGIGSGRIKMFSPQYVVVDPI